MIAAANSFNVFNVSGAESINWVILDCTNAVVAICVVFVVETAVGAVGTPVKLGLAMDALLSTAASNKLTLLSKTAIPLALFVLLA